MVYLNFTDWRAVAAENAAAAAAYAADHKRVHVTSVLKDRTPVVQPQPLPEGEVRWGKESAFNKGDNATSNVTQNTGPTSHFSSSDVFGDPVTGERPLDALPKPTQSETITKPNGDQVTRAVDPNQYIQLNVSYDPSGGTDPASEGDKSVGAVEEWRELSRDEKRVRIDGPDGSYLYDMRVTEILFLLPEGPNGQPRLVKMIMQSPR